MVSAIRCIRTHLPLLEQLKGEWYWVIEHAWADCAALAHTARVHSTVAARMTRHASIEQIGSICGYEL